MNDDGSWSTPKNLGNPLNTTEDDHGLIVSADGHTAYFASGRYKGVGGLDIYGFELPKDARPEDIVIVKGEVRDEKGQAVTDAEVNITYMDTRKTEVIKAVAGQARGEREINPVKVRLALFAGERKVGDLSPLVIERGEVVSLYVTGAADKLSPVWVKRPVTTD